MPNLMQTGAAWLGQRLNGAAGRTVTITQEHRTLTNVVGTVAIVDHQVVDAEGFLTKLQTSDWLFTRSDLAGLELVGGFPLTITETLNGVTTTWDAFPIPDKDWIEDLDTSGILVVVHTKRTASNA